MSNFQKADNTDKNRQGTIVGMFQKMQKKGSSSPARNLEVESGLTDVSDNPDQLASCEPSTGCRDVGVNILQPSFTSTSDNTDATDVVNRAEATLRTHGAGKVNESECSEPQPSKHSSLKSTLLSGLQADASGKQPARKGLYVFGMIWESKSSTVCDDVAPSDDATLTGGETDDSHKNTDLETYIPEQVGAENKGDGPDIPGLDNTDDPEIQVPDPRRITSCVPDSEDFTLSEHVTAGSAECMSSCAAVGPSASLGRTVESGEKCSLNVFHCPVCSKTFHTADPKAFTEHVEDCLSQKHIEDILSAEGQQQRKESGGDKSEKTAAVPPSQGSSNVPAEPNLEFLVCPICSMPQRKSDMKSFNEHMDSCLSRRKIKEMNKTEDLPDTSSSSAPAEDLVGTGILVCPVCNAPQRKSDLQTFNQHVDSCLNRGVIRELIQTPSFVDVNANKRQVNITVS